MAKARAIVKRRKSVSNIRKITRTMQLIATAKFQAAFKRATATRPYTERISQLVSEVSQSAGDVEHPLLKENASATGSAMLVITSNRGLCGGYNSSLLRAANEQIRELEGAGQSVDLQVSGKKGIGYFKYQRRPMSREFTRFDDRPKFAEIEPIADAFMDRFASGQIRSVYVTYMRFESAARQYVETLQLLPLAPPKPEADVKADSHGSSSVYEFSPPPAELLAELLPQMVKVRLFQCFIDATVSEQVARMVAMKSATDAAGDMIKTLTREYNRARQSQITLELLDIVSGAEALR